MKTKDTILKYKITKKCVGLILCGGGIPPDGFRTFAAVCRKFEMHYNDKCRMWYFKKSDKPWKEIQNVRACGNAIADVIPCKQDQRELTAYIQGGFKIDENTNGAVSNLE